LKSLKNIVIKVVPVTFLTSKSQNLHFLNAQPTRILRKTVKFMAQSAQRHFQSAIEMYFYVPLTASMGSNMNPFSPLNFSLLAGLLMVINSVFIVSGAAGFSCVEA
jgi:hypothetical protein